MTLLSNENWHHKKKNLSSSFSACVDSVTPTGVKTTGVFRGLPTFSGPNKGHSILFGAQCQSKDGGMTSPPRPEKRRQLVMQYVSFKLDDTCSGT